MANFLNRAGRKLVKLLIKKPHTLTDDGCGELFLIGTVALIKGISYEENHLNSLFSRFKLNRRC